MNSGLPPKKMTMLSLLAAIALIIFNIEANLPALTPVPGIKLGLANIVTLFALYTLGPGSALFVLFIRIFLGSMFAGQMMSLMYSLAGGLTAFALCAILRRFFKPDQLWILSVFSAITHNAAQFSVAVYITHTLQLVYYLPLLIISGILTGAFTGIAAQTFMLRMKKMGLVDYYKNV